MSSDMVNFRCSKHGELNYENVSYIVPEVGYSRYMLDSGAIDGVVTVRYADQDHFESDTELPFFECDFCGEKLAEDFVDSTRLKIFG